MEVAALVISGVALAVSALSLALTRRRKVVVVPHWDGPTQQGSDLMRIRLYVANAGSRTVSIHDAGWYVGAQQVSGGASIEGTPLRLEDGQRGSVWFVPVDADGQPTEVYVQPGGGKPVRAPYPTRPSYAGGNTPPDD